MKTTTNVHLSKATKKELSQVHFTQSLRRHRVLKCLSTYSIFNKLNFIGN